MNSFNMINKVSSRFHVPLFLILLAGSILVTVKGQICSELLDSCQVAGDCNALCGKTHPGGQGSCDVSNMCKCFYTCPSSTPPPSPSPKTKSCSTSLGIYTNGCVDQQCDSDCRAKFPGAQDGHGFCYSISPFVSCLCRYMCDG